jgi:hypothetical protein
MKTTSLKFAACTVIALAFTSGVAIAGEGKDCDKSYTKTTASTMSTTSETAVMGASSEVKAKKAYSFDEALELCTKKQAKDLQACIDYKTGKAKAKVKPAS